MSDVTKRFAINGLEFSGDVRAVYADELLFAIKADGTCVLSWQFRMPDTAGQEVSRIVVSRPHLERMLDVICGVMKYSPKAGTPPPQLASPTQDHA